MSLSVQPVEDGSGSEIAPPALSKSKNLFFQKIQEIPKKSNIDISLEVSPGTGCIVRVGSRQVNTSVLRYSKVLDEMFDKLGFEEQMPVVPLFEDEEGISGFALFYLWATRDPLFSITKENLSQLLVFTDKYDVPLLVTDITLWARKQHATQVDMQFCTVMLCHCLEFTYLRNELSFWYETINATKISSDVVHFLASPEFKTYLGCEALHDVIIGFVRTLGALEASREAQSREYLSQVLAEVRRAPSCTRGTTIFGGPLVTPAEELRCSEGHRLQCPPSEGHCPPRNSRQIRYNYH